MKLKILIPLVILGFALVAYSTKRKPKRDFVVMTVKTIEKNRVYELKLNADFVLDGSHPTYMIRKRGDLGAKMEGAKQ